MFFSPLLEQSSIRFSIMEMDNNFDNFYYSVQWRLGTRNRKLRCPELEAHAHWSSIDVYFWAAVYVH